MTDPTRAPGIYRRSGPRGSQGGFTHEVRAGLTAEEAERLAGMGRPVEVVRRALGLDGPRREED